MIAGLALIAVGVGFLVYSCALMIWTTLIRDRFTAEPPWVIRAGCTTTLLAFVCCAAGTIISALSVI